VADVTALVRLAIQYKLVDADGQRGAKSDPDQTMRQLSLLSDAARQELPTDDIRGAT